MQSIANIQLTLDNTGTGKPLTDRGYTAHEHLPEFSLVNMNGRVYDPQIGRFLSPDYYVQAPDFSQSFNRYSYCLNNPLKYTDPSGEEAVLLTTLLISAAIAGTINVATNYQNIDNWGRGLAYFAVGAAIGAAGSYVGGLAAYATLATGILHGAVVGGVSGAITSGSLQVANNYITGDTWYNKLGSSMLSGAIGGAINGGIYGFNRANATGANVLTGSREETIWKYDAELKEVALHPNDPYCYSESSAYADLNHQNRTIETFKAAAGNAEGADIYDVWNSFNDKSVVLLQQENITIQHWQSMGACIQDYNSEVILSVNITEDHAVNLTGVRYFTKFNVYGGGSRNILCINYWDTNLGHLSNRNPNIVIKALQINYK